MHASAFVANDHLFIRNAIQIKGLGAQAARMADQAPARRAAMVCAQAASHAQPERACMQPRQAKEGVPTRTSTGF